MNGPTRDTTPGTTVDHEVTAHRDAEDGVFWDAYWTLDDEWLPEPDVPTPLAATAPRPTTDVRPVAVVNAASVAPAPATQPSPPQAKSMHPQTPQPPTAQPQTASAA